MINYQSSQLQYGNQTAQTYLNQQNNNHLFADRIEEWGIINIENLNSQEPYTIKLADYEIITPISLKSVYLFTVTSNNDQIDLFKISRQLEDNSIIDLGTIVLTDDLVPYKFPDGAILFPNNLITINSSKGIGNLFIYYKPVSVIKYTRIVAS